MIKKLPPHVAGWRGTTTYLECSTRLKHPPLLYHKKGGRPAVRTPRKALTNFLLQSAHIETFPQALGIRFALT